MAHLGFKHTAFIDLPGNALAVNSNIPSIESLEVHQLLPIIIQGNTVATFVLSALQTTHEQRDTLGQEYAGIDQLTFNPGDGNEIKRYSGKYNNAFAPNLSATVLPLTSFDHTYYSTTSSATDLSAVVTIVYTQTAGSSITPQPSSLSAAHIIPIRQTAENVVDRNFELLDSQVFTYEDRAVPMFIFETDENVIYPTGFFETNPVPPRGRPIFINTDPETINTTEEYIQYTSFFLTSALSADALPAASNGLNVYGNVTNLLSGGAFQQAGRSGKIFTTVFSITGNSPTLFTNSNPQTQIGAANGGLLGLSAHLETPIITVDVPILTATNYVDRYVLLFSAITAAYYDGGYVGENTEFSNITYTATTTGGNNEIRFYHQFLPPPAATLNIGTPSVSASKSYTNSNLVFTNELAVAGKQSLGLTSSQAGSAVTFLYPHSGYSLSASGRISTDPTGDNITAI